MKRWSKLQKELYLLIDSSINFQIHCVVYRMQSQSGSTDLPRYWITLDKDIIFDYPKQFLDDKILGEDTQHTQIGYPYYTEVQDISVLLREYIDTPAKDIFYKKFIDDNWGLTDILKAADKRIGKRRIEKLLEVSDNLSVQKVIAARL